MMTGRERIENTFLHKPVDHIGAFECFWDDTGGAWAEKGWIPPGTGLYDYFDYDIAITSPFNMVADINFKPVTLEETEETILTLDGNGAKFRQHKLHIATPEHVGFAVSDRESYLEHIRPLLLNRAGRINFEAYRAAKENARRRGQFLMWIGNTGFELMELICGHENLLAGMALDPDWVREMAMDYARLVADLMEELFDREGAPDGIWCFVDLGYKERPFMSPRMFDELLKPAFQHELGYAKARKLPAMLHSCGMVEKLIPGIIESGFDALQPLEVKAGMDLIRLGRQYGDRLVLCGGLDIRALCTNELAIVDGELAKVPKALENGPYILHTDHSVPKTVDLATYEYFLEKGRSYTP